MKEPFVELYDRCFDDVYRYVYSKIGNSWDADDVVSDTFRKAFEKYDTLREHSNPKAWLITIAHHTVADFYRKKKPSVSADKLYDLADPDDFEDRFALDDDLDCVRKSIAALPPEDREIVRLRYFAGLKNREIGEVLGKTEEAVKTRVFRLLKKLSALVKTCLEGAGQRG